MATVAHDAVGSGIAWTALGAGATFVLNYWFQIWKHRDENEERRNAREDKLEQHNKDLTFRLLEAATSSIDALRKDLGQAREENLNLRGYEIRAAYCEEAIKHVRALLHPAEHGGTEGVRNAAKQFLARFELMIAVKGDAGNAEQRERAADRVLRNSDQNLLP